MTNNDLLTKLEQATINEGLFMEIEIRVREGEIVATGSAERGSSGLLQRISPRSLKSLDFKEWGRGLEPSSLIEIL